MKPIVPCRILDRRRLMKTNTQSPQWPDLAHHLVGALKVTAGSRVSVFMTDYAAMPAVAAFVDACYQLGALPQIIASDESFDDSALRHASDELLKVPAPLEMASMEWADIHVSFRAMVPPVSEPDFRKAALLRQAKGAISTKRWENTTWCVVRIPTPAWAEMIQVPFPTLLGEFFDGCLMDWPAVRQRQLALCEVLNQGSIVRVRSHDTDISFGVANRTWVSFAGEANLPDGEVATAPLDDSTQGHITFGDDLWFAGTRISGLRLSFDAGVVVDVTADHGEDFARALIASDEGATRVGELGIGTNPTMTTYTGDLFLDEKILGTMHLAMGRAYPECGGVNKSALHWDLVKDLRTTGDSMSVDSTDLISDGHVVGPLAGCSTSAP